MKAKYVGIALAALLVVGGGLVLPARPETKPAVPATMAKPARSVEGELKVMTYNIGSAAGIPLGPREIDKIAKEIKREQADVVGMTEVDMHTDWHKGRDMVGELAVALARNRYPMHHYYTPTLTYHGGNMVLVIWSRYLIDDGDFVLTKPEGPAGWKAARIEIRPDGKNPLHVFMTHYYIGTPGGHLHQQQTDRVLEFVGRHKGPRIVMGDFNFTPEQPYYKQYLDSGLRDACIETVGKHLPTVGGGAGKVAPEQLAQIDFIFGSDQIRFTGAYVPETTMSDHWPLVASFVPEP